MLDILINHINYRLEINLMEIQRSAISVKIFEMQGSGMCQNFLCNVKDKLLHLTLLTTKKGVK